MYANRQQLKNQFLPDGPSRPLTKDGDLDMPLLELELPISTAAPISMPKQAAMKERMLYEWETITISCELGDLQEIVRRVTMGD